MTKTTHAGTTRRERVRAETEQDIRATALTLLVEHGQEAVTLRAIARRLGITAPALYRYYDSREDLLRHLCDDICTGLATELTADLHEAGTDDPVDQVYAVCRGFRRWALAHPQEFTLVFASPADTGCALTDDGPLRPAQDQFGRIFLAMAGRVVASRVGSRRPPNWPSDEAVPDSLRADLAEFRASLLPVINADGVLLGDTDLGLGTVYGMLRFWVRLYGHVALEVFGRFPLAISSPEPFFDSMLDELMGEFGLLEH